MRKQRVKRDELPYLLFLSAMFVCGCVIGGFVSSNLSGNGLYAASAAADQFLNPGSKPDFDYFIDSVSSAVKLPVMVFLLSLSTVGKPLIGPLFALKGFLMTFFVGAVSAASGTGAFAAAMCGIIPTGIFSLPCMLLLAMGCCKERDSIIHGRPQFPPSTVYFLFLIPAVLADMYVCPLLLNTFAI